MKCRIPHRNGMALPVKLKSREHVFDCMFRIIHDNKHQQVTLFVLTSPYQKFAFFPLSLQNIFPACEDKELIKQSHDSFLAHCQRITREENFQGIILHVLTGNNQLIVVTATPGALHKNCIVVNAPKRTREDARLFIAPYLKA